MASFNVPIEYLDSSISNLYTFKFNVCNRCGFPCVGCTFYNSDADDCRFDILLDELYSLKDCYIYLSKLYID